MRSSERIIETAREVAAKAVMESSWSVLDSSRVVSLEGLIGALATGLLGWMTVSGLFQGKTIAAPGDT
jgi:hypothetical protein